MLSFSFFMVEIVMSGTKDVPDLRLYLAQLWKNARLRFSPEKQLLYFSLINKNQSSKGLDHD